VGSSPRIAQIVGHAAPSAPNCPGVREEDPSPSLSPMRGEEPVADFASAELAEEPAPSVVLGRRLSPGKLDQARALRKRMTPAEKALWRCLRANRMRG